MLITGDSDIPDQLERMTDKDNSVRRDAILTVTGIRDGRLLYPLIKAMQDEDPGIQQAAMNALIAFEDEAAVYNLLPLLADKRVYVRNMTREILEKVGVKYAGLFRPYSSCKDEDVRKMVADILGNMPNPEAKGLLIEMLKDPCINVRSSAAEGLGKIGDSSAVVPLIGLLDDEEWISFFAVIALGRIGDMRAVPYLTRLIGSPNIDLRIAAIEALGQIGGEDAINNIIRVIDSASPDILPLAVESIVRLLHGNIGRLADRFGEERIFDYLAAAVQHTDMNETDMRKYFIKAFSVIRNQKSPSCIMDLISDIDLDNQEIIQIAVDALERLRDEDALIYALRKSNSTSVTVSVKVLGILRSAKAVRHLIDIFDYVDRDTKIEILYALGNIGGKEVLALLIEMLYYTEGHIRGAAARSLGNMAAPEAIESLLGRVRQEGYSDVIATIIDALAAIGLRHNIPSLNESLALNLSNKNPSVRELIIKGLVRLGWINIEEVARRMLSDESWRVRRACLETLSQLNPHGLIDLLITCASDEKDEIRLLVAQLAGEHSEEKAVDLLISLLSDRNSRIVATAIEGLVRLKADNAIPHLIELVYKEDPSIQKTAIWAIAELAGKDAENILRNMKCPPVSETRTAAMETLKTATSKDNAI